MATSLRIRLQLRHRLLEMESNLHWDISQRCGRDGIRRVGGDVSAI